jgi:ABC-type multidrug transport system ATPase subunit
MEIQLKNVGKQFNREWIFRNVNLHFTKDKITAIVGPNGSGKSTLLQVLAGSLLQTEGDIGYSFQNQKIAAEDIHKYLSMAAPAMTLPEDFTLMEFLQFHFKFKKIKKGSTVDSLMSIFKLESARDKYIKNFSTGMKQRVKLGIALYADTPMLLLDEPATNLDRAGFEWYLSEIQKVLNEKLIFVCSNRKDEYSFCNNFIDILAYKK